MPSPALRLPASHSATALTRTSSINGFGCTSCATHNRTKRNGRVLTSGLRKGIFRCTLSGQLKVIRVNKFGACKHLAVAIRGVSLSLGSRDGSCPALAALRPTLATASSSHLSRHCAMKRPYPQRFAARCFAPKVAIAGSAPPAVPVARVSSRSPCSTSNSSFCAFLVFRVRAGFSWMPLLTWT